MKFKDKKNPSKSSKRQNLVRIRLTADKPQSIESQLETLLKPTKGIWRKNRQQLQSGRIESITCLSQVQEIKMIDKRESPFPGRYRRWVWISICHSLQAADIHLNINLRQFSCAAKLLALPWRRGSLVPHCSLTEDSQGKESELKEEFVHSLSCQFVGSQKKKTKQLFYKIKPWCGLGDQTAWKRPAKNDCFLSKQTFLSILCSMRKGSRTHEEARERRSRGGSQRWVRSKGRVASTLRNGSVTREREALLCKKQSVLWMPQNENRCELLDCFTGMENIWTICQISSQITRPCTAFWTG